MNTDTFWSLPRTAGILLVAAIAPLALGVFLFLQSGGLQGRASGSLTMIALERSSIMAAVVLTAIGLLLLERSLAAASGSTFLTAGASLYFFGAILVVAAEALDLASLSTTYPLIVVYVVMALIGQAIIGLGLLKSPALPAWISWGTLGWSLAWLVVLPLATPSDVYFPILHHVMPLLIGIALLRKG